jgi:hypothetical protein
MNERSASPHGLVGPREFACEGVLGTQSREGI